MGLKRYFDLSLAEKIIIVITQFIEGNENVWINKVRRSVGASSNRIFDDCVYLLMNYDLLRKENCSTKSKKGQKTYITVTDLCTQIVKYGYIKPLLEDTVLPNVPSKGKRRGKNAQVDKAIRIVKRIHNRGFQSRASATTRKGQGPRDNPDQEQQQNRWKAIHFLLNRGAFGVGYNIPDGLSLSGNVYYTSERREGVSIMDLVEEKDDSFIEVNSYIRVSKPEAERIIQILLAEGIMEEISQRDNNIAAVNRNGQKKSEDVRYGIKDYSLAEYILQWGCFQSAVLSRMLYLYDSIKGTMRGIHPIEREVRWLRDAIGPGKAERWLASASVRRGKTVVAYVSPSLQDINKLDDATQRSIHKRRKRYLRDEDVLIKRIFREIRDNPELKKVEKNYPVITQIIKRSVYPEFLLELYERQQRRRKTRTKEKLID